MALKIIKTIKDNESVTIREMADITGATERTVQRYLQDFQNADILKREGGDKGGRWLLL